MKPHFGVDVDGVLAHHFPAMLEIVKELTGLAVSPDQVTDYYFAGLVSRDLMEQVFERCMERAMDLPPMADYHLVNELPGTVTIVTHRPAEVAEQTTKEWLRRHGIRYDGIVFTKGRKSETGRFDYFIDDAPQNALDLASAGATTYLMAWPYNRESHFGEHDHRVVRVGGWKEIQEHLHSSQRSVHRGS